jgi:enediyne biosynthesis protein E2
MATLTGRLRRRLLAPTEGDVTFAARGFPVTDGPAVRHLEAVPAAVVRGFRGTVDGSPLPEVAARAASEPDALRGFHHEGAVMAACVVDAMDPRGSTRARDLLTGPARDHVLLGWIGVGFALAKLPPRIWSRAVPDLDDVPHQAVLDALAIDGWAFDLAFFDPPRYLGRQERVPAVPWRGSTDGVPRVADQGLGRALWFFHGAQVARVAAAVESFAPHRRPDLWAGVGLAATLAGGAAADDLRRLADAGDGGDADELALGAVLAARAAQDAAADTGTVPAHVATGVRALAGTTVRDAADLVTALAPEPDASGVPAYLSWRERIRARFAASPAVRAG